MGNYTANPFLPPAPPQTAAAQLQTPEDNGVPEDLHAYQMQEQCNHDAAALFRGWQQNNKSEPGFSAVQVDYDDNLTSLGCFIHIKGEGLCTSVRAS
jgi:hypothetical protein